MLIITKDYINYLAAMYGSSLTFFAFKMAIARALGPKDFGLWSILSLILAYSGFSHLGLGNALVKEVSFNRGQGNHDIITESRDTVFSFMAMVSLIFASFLIVWSFMFARAYSADLFIALFILAFILVLQQLKNYFSYYFSAEKNFKAIRELKLLSILLSGVISVALVVRFKFIGLPLGILSGYILVLAYIFNKYRPEFRFQLKKQRFMFLARIGLPIMISSLAYNLFITVDKLFIFKFLGKESLGYYAIALSLNGFLLLLPVSLGAILFPRFSERYGAEGGSEKLKELLYVPMLTIVYFMSILSGLIYVFLPVLVRLIMPQYAPGIPAARIALFGAMFLSTGLILQNFLISINRQMHYLYIVFSALGLKTALLYSVLHQRAGISAVAGMSNIVYFAYSAFIMLFAFSYCCKAKVFASFKYLIKIYLPFAYLLVVLFLPLAIKEQAHIFLLIALVAVPFGFLIKRNLRILNNLVA